MGCMKLSIGSYDNYQHVLNYTQYARKGLLPGQTNLKAYFGAIAWRIQSMFKISRPEGLEGIIFCDVETTIVWVILEEMARLTIRSEQDIVWAIEADGKFNNNSFTILTGIRRVTILPNGIKACSSHNVRTVGLVERSEESYTFREQDLFIKQIKYLHSKASVIVLKMKFGICFVFVHDYKYLLAIVILWIDPITGEKSSFAKRHKDLTGEFCIFCPAKRGCRIHSRKWRRANPNKEYPVRTCDDCNSTSRVNFGRLNQPPEWEFWRKDVTNIYELPFWHCFLDAMHGTSSVISKYVLLDIHLTKM